jgi:hypothetical protein
VVDEDLGPPLERAGGGGQVAQLDVEDVRGGDPAGMREQVAAREVLHGDAAEVERGAVAGERARGGGAVDLDPAHARGGPAREHGELVTERDAAAEDRPGDDRAEALHREHAIDRQPEHASVRAGRQRGDLGGDRGAEVVQAGAGPRRDRHERRIAEERAGDHRPDVRGDHREPLVVDEVALRQRDEPAPHAEQLADVEVLAGLRHHALVRGDHEADQIEPGRAGDHRLHEPLVAGDVDDGDPLAAEVHAREAELGRDPARLLDGEPVGVDAGERADERRLAVIDVAGGAEDDRERRRRARRRTR